MRITLKVLMLGDFAVGKTSLVQRYVEHHFSSSYLRTIGVDIYTKEIIRNNGKNHYLFQIWDLSGDEEFRFFRHDLYRGALGGILAADLTRKETMSSLPKWIEECEKHAISNFRIVFAGNKLDLLNNDMTHPNIKFFMDITESWDYDKFLVSAKTGFGVDKLFLTLFEHVINI